MTAKFFRQLLACSLAVLLWLLIPGSTRACGPFFTDAIFIYTKHPDFPLQRFAAGQLGVLRPSYARSYLVAAYRNLIGVPLSANEAKSLASLWEDRLGNAGELNADAWIKTWEKARSQVPGAGPPVELHAFRHREKPHEYESFLN